MTETGMIKLKTKLPFLFILLILLILSCKEPGKKDFVRVEGKNLMIGDSIYVFTGVNFWQGAYLGADLIKGGKKRLIRELDLMKKTGITNLRITAASERSALKMAVKPAFQNNPGEYNEILLKGLDFLLNEMGKRDMRAVMVMGNYWQWSGGMAQYVAWETGDSIVDPDKTGNWHGFMCYSASFYKNQNAWHSYFNYLEHVITRINTFNHLPYAQDPTIMTWQLANEPRPHPESITNPELLVHYYAWIDSTAKYIHSLAPHQLVTTGNEGLAGSLYDSAIYINAHAFKSIDYITFHIWPKNWGWFVADDMEKTLPETLVNTVNYFNQHSHFAKQLNKPIVLEEFGLGRDYELYEVLSSVYARNEFLKTIFNQIEINISQDGPVAGTNVWAWGGEGRAHDKNALWKEGTDFTGDPPQEPQGLNSIYDCDYSTLTLFYNHFVNLKKSSQ